MTACERESLLFNILKGMGSTAAAKAAEGEAMESLTILAKKRGTAAVDVATGGALSGKHRRQSTMMAAATAVHVASKNTQKENRVSEVAKANRASEAGKEKRVSEVSKENPVSEAGKESRVSEVHKENRLSEGCHSGAGECLTAPVRTRLRKRAALEEPWKRNSIPLEAELDLQIHRCGFIVADSHLDDASVCLESGTRKRQRRLCDSP